MTSATRSVRTGTAPTPDPDPGRRPAAAIGALALLGVAGAWLLPVWQATLHAPQYPGGLTMYAYGNKVTGDVGEIDNLNHYVGMRPFDPADVPEMQLWPFVLGLAAVAVVIGLLVRRGLPGRFARLYLWATPVGVVAALQLRLHQYGHDLEPLAALRIEPFTPWVVGPTKVWNFTTWARPGLGLLALVASAVLVSFGPRWWSRRQHGRSKTGTVAAPRGAGTGRGASVAALLAVLLTTGALPVAAAQSQDHAGHGHGSDDDGRGQPASGRPPAPGPTAEPTREVVGHPPAGDLASLLEGIGDGGRLVLPPGTYQGPVVIDRPVTIDGRDLPLIQGDGEGNVITIRAAGTVLRGIAVRGSGVGPTGNPAAIRIEADDVRIEGVVVEDSYMGIAVAGADRVTVLDNVVRGRASVAIGDDGHAVAPGSADSPAADTHHETGHGVAARGRGDGVWLHDAEATLIRGNRISDARDGIYVSFGRRVLVDGNHVHGSRYAVHSMFAEDLSLVENHSQGNLSGMVLMYGGSVLILRNTVQDSTSASTGFGVLLKDVVEAELMQNVLVDNRVGIHLEGPAGADTATTVGVNTVARNTLGVSAYSSARAAFHGNSFADNTVQVMSQGGELAGVSWIDRGWGNYWSTYRGYRLGDTERGAVAHVEGGTVDRLLLRHPHLAVLADGPALRLLRGVEERWGAREPVATDAVPLIDPVSPALPAPVPEPSARPLGLALALAVLLPSLAVLWRPRRRPARSRRYPRAVPA